MNRNTRWVVMSGAILVSLLIALALIFGARSAGVLGYRGPGMMGGYWGGSGMMGYGWGMWWMPVLMVIFWGLVVWGIIALVRYFARTGCGAGGQDTALEILRKRYASGEIAREEFEEKKKALM